MNINHRVAPTPHVPQYTSKPRTPHNQQKQSKKQSKKQTTSPVPFLNFLQQWFKPEKKGEIQNGN